ncbi:hypothetical protein EAO69_19780 [Streptomyces sp. me109]|nr:hypothetical protein EAO69_19780 [Streptomyces sp. me109]
MCPCSRTSQRGPTGAIRTGERRATGWRAATAARPYGGHIVSSHGTGSTVPSCLAASISQ